MLKECIHRARRSEGMMNGSREERIEERLLRERGRIFRTIVRARRIRPGIITPEYRPAPAPAAGDVICPQCELELDASAGPPLAAVEDALRRLYQDPDAFGRCEVCRQGIEDGLLFERPWVRRCAHCASDVRVRIEYGIAAGSGAR
jgi:RNA polymerase-binding transcription factor DksA